MYICKQIQLPLFDKNNIVFYMIDQREPHIRASKVTNTGQNVFIRMKNNV